MAKASDILRRAEILLVDEGFVRWTLPELAGWINEAVDAILIAKPSASSATRTIKLAKGTRQEIPSKESGQPEPMMFLAAIRNVAHDGKPGRSVTSISMNKMNLADPDWHSERRCRSHVDHYIFDEHVPREFYVYPANDGTGHLDVSFSCIPVPIEATGDEHELSSYDQEVGLPEPYSVPILDYVAYRAQSKDGTDSNPGRAQFHYQQFAQAIGIKIQVEGASSPNARRAAP